MNPIDEHCRRISEAISSQQEMKILSGCSMCGARVVESKGNRVVESKGNRWQPLPGAIVVIDSRDVHHVLCRQCVPRELPAESDN